MCELGWFLLGSSHIAMASYSSGELDCDQAGQAQNDELHTYSMYLNNSLLYYQRHAAIWYNVQIATQYKCLFIYSLTESDWTFTTKTISF